jgi:hypothetical protein
MAYGVGLRSIPKPILLETYDVSHRIGSAGAAIISVVFLIIVMKQHTLLLYAYMR